MFTTLALLLTGAIGMIGWLFAWRARGDALEREEEVAKARAGEMAAIQAAHDAAARAVQAQSMLDARASENAALRSELDSERLSKQTLLHALAKSGAPVGPAVVDGAIGRLYPDRDQGDQGSGSR